MSAATATAVVDIQPNETLTAPDGCWPDTAVEMSVKLALWQLEAESLEVTLHRCDQQARDALLI